jgi:hypothetical protein
VATLTQRWWAPTEPGIGPDEFDLSLFAAGDAPDRDLGQHVLALHRVGAAACEAVATQPLADEVTLRAVLATAREMVAPPAVEAVSKAFDTPSYGALLLKDLLDDAEQAAVTIYRTCVTKQMAPSMAAHRVGLVYGVPIRELGRYSALATDPKANKDAVQELADRTLFTFVGKLLADEAPTGAKELVSKAPAERERSRLQVNQLQALFDRSEAAAAAPKTQAGDGDSKQHTHGEQYLDEHNVEHGEAGRFVREGTQQQRPVLRRQKLARKTLRRADLRPRSAEQAPAAGAQLGQAELGRARLGRAGTETRQLGRKATRLQDLLAKLEVPPVASGTGRELPDDVNYLERVRDPNAGEYTQLWHSVSFVFPTDEWNARKAGMALMRDEDGTEQLMFRAHALDGGGPFEGEDENGHVSGRHDDARKSVAGNVHADERFAGQPKPYVHRVENAEDLLRNPAALRKAKLDFLQDVQDRVGRNLAFDREIAFVTAAADHDHPEDLVLVWTPPTPGGNPLKRPVKQVTEVFIDEDSAQGTAEITRHGADITIDPNQPLRILGRRMFWVDDSKNGYLLHQLEAVSAYEDEVDALAKDRERRRKRGFGKGLVVAKAINERNATQLQQLQALFDRSESRYLQEHHVDNDETTGRFERAEGPVRRKKLERTTLRRAQVRPALLGTTGRRAETGHAELGRAELGHAETDTRGLSRAALAEAATAAREGAGPQTVFLDPGFDYRVLDMQEVGFILDDSNVKYLEQAYDEPFKLGLSAQAMVAKPRDITSSDDAYGLLQAEADSRFTALPWPNKGGIWKPVTGTYAIDDDKDLSGIALELEDYVNKNDDVQMLRVVMYESLGKYHVNIYANTGELGHSHLVRFDSVTHGPLQLRPEGARRLMDAKGINNWLLMRFHGGKPTRLVGRSDDYLPIPTVHTWVAEPTDDAP